MTSVARSAGFAVACLPFLPKIGSSISPCPLIRLRAFFESGRGFSFLGNAKSERLHEVYSVLRPRQLRARALPEGRPASS